MLQKCSFCSFSVHFFVFWVCSDLQGHHGSFCEHPRSSWHPLKPKIHAKIARNRQKTAAFLFMVHIGILRRMLQPLKCSQSHDVLCLKMQLKFIIRLYILHSFPHKETRLHKPSLSWQAIANLLDFCVLRQPWPPRTSWHSKENACLLLWTSGGCQSEGPRGLRPLGPTDWHPPSVQSRRHIHSLEPT